MSTSPAWHIFVSGTKQIDMIVDLLWCLDILKHFDDFLLVANPSASNSGSWQVTFQVSNLFQVSTKPSGSCHVEILSEPLVETESFSFSPAQLFTNNGLAWCHGPSATAAFAGDASAWDARVRNCRDVFRTACHDVPVVMFFGVNKKNPKISGHRIDTIYSGGNQWKSTP